MKAQSHNVNTTILSFRWLYANEDMIMNIIFNFCPQKKKNLDTLPFKWDNFIVMQDSCFNHWHWCSPNLKQGDKGFSGIRLFLNITADYDATGVVSLESHQIRRCGEHTSVSQLNKWRQSILAAAVLSPKKYVSDCCKKLKPTQFFSEKHGVKHHVTLANHISFQSDWQHD